MKQVRTQLTTKFADYEEACRYIALYAGCGGNSPEYQALEETVPGWDRLSDPQAALVAAIKLVAERNGVALPPVVPTYISGSADRVTAISEMPTRHLKNVLNFSDERMARGLRVAIESELRRRA